MKISGNKINGLNELKFRRPEYVYWRDPKEITFGELQKWFYKQNIDPKLQDGRNDRIIEEAVSIAEISDTLTIKTENSPLSSNISWSILSKSLKIEGQSL